MRCGAGTEPLPTTLRAVSGKKRNSTSRKELPVMSRNQNVHGQPALSDNSPPTSGAEHLAPLRRHRDVSEDAVAHGRGRGAPRTRSGSV